MGFKLISKEGDGLSILKVIQHEGQEVLAYIGDESAKKMYDGMLPKVDSALSLDFKKDDVIIFDMVGAGHGADTLKRKRYTVIGGGSFNDKLELDRDFGNQFLKSHGVHVPPTHEFDNFASAKKFLDANKDKSYVFKPLGNLDTSLTYVGTSNENLIGMLPYLESKVPSNCKFELQEVIHGIEMSTEAWFNGDKFLLPINSTMEEKKFLDGNLGRQTGCMGNIVWFWDMETSQFLYDLLFKNMEDDLRKAHYLGPLDINAIWTADGPYALEFTARFGYDAIQAMTRIINVPVHTFFEELQGLGKMPAMNVPCYGMALRISIPPFPYHIDVPELPVLNGASSYAGALFLSDVFMDKGTLKCAGSDGYICAVVHATQSLDRLQAHVYNIAESLEIPDKQYRLDIGDRVPKDRRAVEKIISKMSKK